MKSLALVVLVLTAWGCKEPCSESNCPGCCDSAGECQVGTRDEACGRVGQCAVCRSGVSACVRQSCVAVDGGTSPDGGAGGGAAGCLIGTCGSLNCNPQTRECEAPSSCDAAAAQPAGCGGGRRCEAGTCRDLPRPCANFSSSSGPQRWSPATDFGPVIYEAAPVSFAVVAAGCPPGSPKRAVVRLKAYDFMGRFTPDGGAPSLRVHLESMILSNVTDGLTVTPEAGGQTATLEVASCGGNVSRLTLGYAFERGNGVCVTLQ